MLISQPSVCLVTTVQPSSNPRLVKEADALVEAGYRVQAVGAWYSEWAASFDRGLLASRAWQFRSVDWRREAAPWLFWKTRLRHRAAKSLVLVPGLWRPAWRAALTRVTPELTRAAVRVPADLYIAHNLGALPAAIAAARCHSAAVGFDAEDFHSGELSADREPRRRRYIERVERSLLPRCDYVTAASPLIAEAYGRLSGVPRPVCVLNVFPLAERPEEFRRSAATGPFRLYWFSQTIGADRGLDEAVTVMGQLREWPIELHLRGTWQAGYRKALLELADRVGVPRARIVSHEPAAPSEMVRLASEYDVGLATEQRVCDNREIALTNKLFVYLLAGIGVIATRTRAQSSLCAHFRGAAATYEPGDVSQLAAVLRRWVSDREALAEARGMAWQLGETRYNWDIEKQTFLSVVRGVLGAGGRIRERESAERGKEAGTAA